MVQDEFIQSKMGLITDISTKDDDIPRDKKSVSNSINLTHLHQVDFLDQSVSKRRCVWLILLISMFYRNSCI